ncbi:MAG TPA: four helix bundle protein [Gemmatimonadales bacterium]|nr:four helix bundle protein [Gemmatimonadales bacterium]
MIPAALNDANSLREGVHFDSMGDFKKLRVWVEAQQFAVLSSKAIKQLPDYERFILADQWRRAAYSVPLNIAEGTGRKGQREFCRYLGIAWGSLHELEAILELIGALEYIPADELATLKTKRADCARMIYGLIRRFR